MSCGNSRSSKCNPCGPSEAALNEIANKAAYYARIAQYASDGFSQVYLGAKDVAPTTDNIGNPLIVGALYFNTASDFLYVWNGTTWEVTTFNETTPFLSTGSTTARTLANRFADVVNVKDFGAVGDGVADDSVAIQAAINTGKDIYFPEGNYKTNTAITNLGRSFGFGASFSGTFPIDAYPAFGTGVFKTISWNFNNGIIGIVDNKLPSSTVAFPTGVTGYGKNNNNGNTAFGIYAEARQFANAGVVSNEIDSFNHGASPSTNLPPNRSIGTTQQHPIALTIGAGGTANSSIGIHIAKEGSSPQQFLTGIYIDTDSTKDYGLFIDSTSSSTHTSIVAKHSVSNTAINVRGVGVPVANNSWIAYIDGSGNNVFSIRQDGRIGIDSSALRQTTVGAAGAAQVLPSNPTGYFKVIVGGFTKVIPYYEP